MEHLTPDTIARLVDETPTEAETAHITECADCAAELDLARETTEALGQLPDVRPPRGDWAVLEARLVSEGLVQTEGGFRSSLARTPGWMKSAAAVLLFLSGTGLGATMDRTGLIPATGAPAGAAGGIEGVGFASAAPTSVEEAAEAVQLAERGYMDALVRYRQMVDVEGSPEMAGDSERRYAALEYFVAAAEVAVREAPADPFMNGLLASVRAERQVALRQASRTQDWY